MNHQDLHPFVSLQLAESPQRTGAGLAAALLDGIAGQLQGQPKASDLNQSANIVADGDLQVGWLTYRESKPAAWIDHDSFIDRINHLVLVCVQGSRVAFYASDPMIVRMIQRGLDTDHDVVTGDLERISPPRLNAAFVRDKTVTLWLSGLHRRTDTKVDNKVITGSDLRYALDPLNDQTYAFSAARSRISLAADTSHTIGVAPVKSSVWLGPSPGWTTFADLVRKIFAAIPAKKGVSAPLPCLAVPIDTQQEFAKIKSAFDASLVSTEEFEVELTKEDQERLAVWRDVRVAVSGTKKAKFTARLFWPTEGDYVKAGTLTGEPGLSSSGLVDQKLSWEPAGGASQAVLAAAKGLYEELTRRPSLLKVWYETGHVLTGSHLHRMQFREFAFDGFIWEDFTDYDVTKEKPKPLSTEEIGEQDSLFCWVFNKWKPDGQRRWKGWLVCTDGSMEMADFIHLNEEGSELTLIHAKGADSNSPKRQVSVASYEIVASQAVKNLRHLDPEIVAGRFHEAIDERLKDACWHDGRLVSKARMLARLQQVGASIQRRVLILQPHARKSDLLAKTNDQRAKIRAAQLHTLLVGVQQNCRSLNARFGVISDGR